MNKNNSNKIIVILNPIAGKGTAVNYLSQIEDRLKKNGRDFSVLLTEAPGHAMELAGNFAQDKNNVIIAAGGDGTCNEVINGLMKGRKDHIPIFGVLPLGRGNDFSYGCGIPPKFDSAMEIINYGEAAPLDVGLIKGGFYPKGRYFGNGVGIGFDTVVGLEAAKMPHVHDAMAYVFGALKTLIKFSDSPTVEISFNGKTATVEVIQISLMNGSRMGGLFYMAPDAVNSDGKIDLCVVNRLNRIKLLRTIIHYTKGTQENLDWVDFDRSDNFSLKAIKGGMVVHADGETICIDGKQLEVRCLPGALKMIQSNNKNKIR